MAKELPEDISSVDVMVVANLATRMGNSNKFLSVSQRVKLRTLVSVKSEI